MEALSPTMEEGQIVRWLKAEGDTVEQGEVLAEIETDKATMELVARGTGVLRAILAAEGTAAPVGDVIAVIAEAEEDIAALVEGTGARAAAPDAAAPPVQEAEPEEAAAATAPAGSAPSSAAGEDGGRVRASPVARRLAHELGVDMSMVAGSGPGGRVVKRDVEEASARASAEPSHAGVVAIGDSFTDIPLSQMRKTVARRLSESLGPVPHFFLAIDPDMTRLMEARERLNRHLAPEGVKVSVNDFIIKAAAVALSRHPECNAWWQGDSIRRFQRVHIGVAVAVPDGLITPVIRDAHLKGIAEISAEARELAGRARDKKLHPDEYTGSTFSISNLGMFGIESFTAVINPPEAGILAIGTIEERAVVDNGQVVCRPQMRITMSCDHRVIDGAQGARFLATLRTFLEEPAAMLLQGSVPIREKQ